MKNKFYIALLLLLLTGCDQQELQSNEDTTKISPVVPEKVLIDFPALTVIEKTISQLVPKLDGGNALLT